MLRRSIEARIRAVGAGTPRVPAPTGLAYFFDLALAGVWDKALPAASLSFAVDLSSRSTSLAADAAFVLVCFVFLGMDPPSQEMPGTCRSSAARRQVPRHLL